LSLTSDAPRLGFAVYEFGEWQYNKLIVPACFVVADAECQFNKRFPPPRFRHRLSTVISTDQGEKWKPFRNLDSVANGTRIAAPTGQPAEGFTGL